MEPVNIQQPVAGEKKIRYYETPRRLHPLTMFYQGIVSSPQILLPLLIGIQSFEEGFFVVFTIIIAVLFLPSIVLRYLYFTFYINQQEVVIESGIFARNKRVIPLRKIQNVSIQQNFFQRLLRIANVSIETAGSQGAEGALQYVSLRAAAEIREVVRLQQESLSENETTTGADGEVSEAFLGKAEVEEVAAEQDIKLSFVDVLKGGMVRFRPIVLLPIGYFMQYMGNQHFTERLTEIVVSNVGEENVEIFTKADTVNLILLIGLVVLLAVAVSWVFSVALFLNTYFSFHVQRVRDRFFVKHGLLSKVERTIPLKRIQTVRLADNPLMRRFGLSSVLAHTAGSAVEQGGGPMMLMPTASIPFTRSFAATIVSFSPDVILRQVSPLAVRRIFIRLSVPVLLATPFLTYFVATEWLFALLLLPLALLHATLRYRAHGFYIHENSITIREGYFFRSESIIPIEKIQTIHLKESFFQRRLGLASLLIDTAATNAIADATIQDISAEEARELLEELSAVFLEKVDAIPDAPSEDETVESITGTDLPNMNVETQHSTSSEETNAPEQNEIINEEDLPPPPAPDEPQKSKPTEQ